MILINGQFSNTVNVTDRSVQYGDGLFETLRVQNGIPLRLQQHLKRLQLGCGRLLIPCPSLVLLVDEALTLAKDQKLAVLKIIVTRGEGGRGYRQPETIEPTRILSLHPFPEYPIQYKQLGVAARFCEMRLSLNPSLAGIKHLNRLEQVLARAEWHDPDIQEGIMLDSLGRVIEGTMSNLFYIKNQQLCTSPLKFSGVAGIVRDTILQLAEKNAIAVNCCYFKMPTLLQADEIFVCNSVIGIWPVRQLASQTFNVGVITQQLMCWLGSFHEETI